MDLLSPTSGLSSSTILMCSSTCDNDDAIDDSRLQQGALYRTVCISLLWNRVCVIDAKSASLSVLVKRFNGSSTHSCISRCKSRVVSK